MDTAEFFRDTTLTVTCLCGCGAAEILSGNGASLTMEATLSEEGAFFSHYVVRMPAVAPHGHRPVKVRGVTPDGIFAFPMLVWREAVQYWRSYPDRDGIHFASKRLDEKVETIP